MPGHWQALLPARRGGALMPYIVTPGARLEVGPRGKLYETLGALTEAQENALVDIDPAELKALPVESRVELALQHANLEVRRREAFWSAVQGFAIGAIPIMGLFGLQRFLGLKR